MFGAGGLVFLDYVQRPMLCNMSTLLLVLATLLLRCVQALQFKTPNVLYQGSSEPEATAGCSSFDGPKLTPWANASSYDW